MPVRDVIVVGASAGGVGTLERPAEEARARRRADLATVYDERRRATAKEIEALRAIVHRTSDVDAEPA